MLPPSPTRALVLSLALVAQAAAGPPASSKRGLVFTPNSSNPQDNYIWASQPSDLSWYYNYQEIPSPAFDNVSQSAFEFVPMMWGKPGDVSDTAFFKTVRQLVQDKGVNITHALSFNEPDGPAAYGGSDIDPAVAAQIWVNNFEPLRKLGIRVGLPACTGAPAGLTWLKGFLKSCSEIVSDGGPTKNCTYDFVPLHWYGNFEGLASHMGEYAAAFPNKTMWLTEYNLDHQDLASTQYFYNTSAEYMDRLPLVERYSLFGAFRSDVSNVGPNAAMLSAGGELTDIGAWYLGRPATGVHPTTGGGSARGVSGCQATAALVGTLFATVAALLSF